MKSTLMDMDPFWVLHYLYKVGHHLPYLFFNSALDWLSFINKHNEFSARDHASSASTLSNHKV